MIRTTASFLAILATSLIAAPVETSARGGGAFVGGHAMSFRGGVAPIIRPAIAPPPLRFAAPARIHAALIHAAPARIHAVPARIHGTFARFRRAPAAVWIGAPWYSSYGYGAPGYSGYDYDDSTYVTPVQQMYAGSFGGLELTTAPRVTPSVPPPKLGCRTQTYKVPSSEGGETSVNVMRC